MDYRAAARQASRRAGIDANVFVRQIQQESGFNPNARSPAGALGIAQIMPATAKGWKVNPMDPVAALNAAARNMAQYVKRYGSYENALRAYNAGPGAIEKSKRYRETNDYVQRILGGSEPSSRPRRAAPTAAQPQDDGDEEETTTVDNSPMRRALISQLVTSKGGDLADFALNYAAAQDVTTRTPKAPQSRPRPRSSGAPVRGGTRPSDQLTELFYDPVGGIKRGQEIGAIGGHGDHVHAATGPKQLGALKKLATDMGLTITSSNEGHPGDGVHTPTSYHYKNRAIDVGGDPRKMRAFALAVKRRYGLR